MRRRRRAVARDARAQARSATANGLVAGLLVVTLMGVLLLAVGRAGLLAGSAPVDLGVREGLLAPPTATPNSVSSQARHWPAHPRREAAHIDPLPAPAGAQTLQQLAVIIEATPGAQLLQQEPDYLRAAFRTRWLGFVDDAEFWWDAANGVVQVRSASRLGEADLGVNRRRIDTLRAALDGAPGRTQP
jgi:uncharacterized protein (DUF1499 family)